MTLLLSFFSLAWYFKQRHDTILWHPLLKNNLCFVLSPLPSSFPASLGSDLFCCCSQDLILQTNLVYTVLKDIFSHMWEMDEVRAPFPLHPSLPFVPWAKERKALLTDDTLTFSLTDSIFVSVKAGGGRVRDVGIYQFANSSSDWYAYKLSLGVLLSKHSLL